MNLNDLKGLSVATQVLKSHILCTKNFSFTWYFHVLPHGHGAKSHLKFLERVTTTYSGDFEAFPRLHIFNSASFFSFLNLETLVKVKGQREPCHLNPLHKTLIRHRSDCDRSVCSVNRLDSEPPGQKKRHFSVVYLEEHQRWAVMWWIKRICRVKAAETGGGATKLQLGDKLYVQSTDRRLWILSVYTSAPSVKLLLYCLVLQNDCCAGKRRRETYFTGNNLKRLTNCTCTAGILTGVRQ